MLQKIIENEINIGLAEPATLLHVTDTHITLADNRDDQRKRELAAARAKYFPNSKDYLIEAAEVSEKEGDLLVHTGDMIDFVSYENLDYARQYIAAHDPFFIAGNHEFSLYVGEAWEDEAYRNQSLSLVQSAFRQDIRFCSREYKGVNLVGIDDGYYLFDRPQLDALKAEVAKGLPIILCMHDPIYEKSLHDFVLSFAECSYVVGQPLEELKKYSEYRCRQQTPDDITLETIDYIKNEPTIVAVLAGHLHRDFESEIAPGKTQYCTGIGTLRRIVIK